MPRILFVSDIHITPQVPSRFEHFNRFISGEVGRLDELYLVGDIFEYWIGPRHLELGDYRPMLDLLKALVRKGVRVHFVTGNRDYLVCERFEEATGVRVWGERCVIDLDGRRVCLLHGDRMYNRDWTYTLYRRFMDLRWVRKCFTSLPTGLGRGIAGSFRSTTMRVPKGTYPSTQEEIVGPTRRVFQEGMDVLICGHIHKPCHLQVDLGKRTGELFVLGEWDEQCDYLEYQDGRFSLRSFRASAVSHG